METDTRRKLTVRLLRPVVAGAVRLGAGEILRERRCHF
jgi:uncharacterized membrane protein YhiD involved in acid resistance